MQQAHTLPIDTLLENGKYRVDALLGQGGFGITYKATQTSLGRTVVVKEFFMDGKCTRSADGKSVTIQSMGQGDYESYKDRFFEEAKLLAQFGNLPGIVNVIDFFRENNTVYYAMDFIEGETLAQHLLRLPQERMAPAEAAELVRKVALALAPVHARNVLHRDLKPANIIRQPNGEPVVLDFGAARAFISDRTAVHSVILTPGYAPPEQYNATGKHGPATDIYALGAVLYRLLTGQTPPASPSRFEEEMASPRDLDPNIPPALSEAVMKAMALRSADRFAGMAELAEMLKKSTPPTIEGTATDSSPRVEKTERPTFVEALNVPLGTEQETASQQDLPAEATWQANQQMAAESSKKEKKDRRRWLPLFWLALAVAGIGIGWYAWGKKDGPTEGTNTQATAQNDSLPEKTPVAEGPVSPEPDKPLSDRDGDGLPDEYDGCPDQAGEKNHGGCPPEVSPAQRPAPASPPQKEERPAPAPAPSADGSYTETVNGVSFKMVRVTGGTFTMGCTAEQGGDCYGDEKPSHQVTLSSYRIGETEVTQALWRAVMGSNPSHFSGCDQCPVESVSWGDTQQFIQKLNSLTGKRYRLPTEAEWEFAARGGNKCRGYKYSGSNNINAVAWFDSNSGNRTHAVKGADPNELGLYDMTGNVWEWCQDWYGDYPSGGQSNPSGAGTGSFRVFRGGSWSYFPRRCRVSYRTGDTPDSRGSTLGFRLASQ